MPVRKFIVPVYPSPEGSRNNQFAPFRIGVNELILSIILQSGILPDTQIVQCNLRNYLLRFSYGGNLFLKDNNIISTRKGLISRWTSSFSMVPLGQTNNLTFH